MQKQKPIEHKTPPAEILRFNDVLAMTGIRSKAAIDAMIREGKFPRKIKLGKRSVGFRAADVKEWIATRPEVA